MSSQGQSGKKMLHFGLFFMPMAGCETPACRCVHVVEEICLTMRHIFGNYLSSGTKNKRKVTQGDIRRPQQLRRFSFGVREHLLHSELPLIGFLRSQSIHQ